MNHLYLYPRENECLKLFIMITKLIIKGEETRDKKITVTRLKEANIVNTGLLEDSERLAKAYSMNLYT